HFRLRPLRSGRGRVGGYRARDSVRAGAADLRSVFHHQGGRERHGPGPVHHLRDHQGAWRYDLGREPARRRRHVPHPAAARFRRNRGDVPVTTTLSVLIVDDDPALLQALPQALRLRMGGVTVETADSAAAALERIAERDYDAIVADIKMPGMDGLELLTEIRTRRPDTPTLMITGHGENDLVVGALRGGACDFLHKPIDRDYLVSALQRAMEGREARRRVKERQVALERHLSELEAVVEERTRERRPTTKVSESPLSLLQGSSGQMDEVVRQIKRVADSPLTVLIQGETGTGKELVARAIHQLSARRDKPFVAVDCGAIPDTLIESELFGYEKGAFTGAHERKEGQFQLAGG